MYEAYFGLQKRPFSATPDASCLFAPPAIQSVLDELAVRASSGEGIGILTAPTGMGKTLLCRCLLSELSERHTPLFLANANFPTRRALLQAMHYELGLRYSGRDEQELRLELISSLKEFVHSGRPLVAIVDEAHLLNTRLLEELRAFASQSESGQPLLRLILVGQLSLEEKLIDPALTALNQRIVAHVYLEPFTREEGRQYMAHRVAWAGGEIDRLFEPDAADAIARIAAGVPRCLNQLSDHCLLLACVHESTQVTREIVAQAHRDLKQLPLLWNELAAEPAPVRPESSAADDDLLESESPATSRGWCDTPRPASGALAFEIGEEASGFADEQPGAMAHDLREPEIAGQPEPTWVPGEQGAGRVVPLPGGGRSSVRVFHEERVDDRYASLDRSAPRLARTFDDLVGSAHPPAMELPPIVPAEPARPVEEPVEEIAPSAVLEPTPASEAPAVSELSLPGDRSHAEEDESPAEESVMELAPEPPAESTVMEVEEAIGESVLDTCLEIQQSLGNWWEAAESALDATTSQTAAASPFNEGFPEFDVVEPERARESASVCVESVSSDPPAGGGRYVPAPSHRHVFSLLRRKLGKTFRHY